MITNDFKMLRKEITHSKCMHASMQYKVSMYMVDDSLGKQSYKSSSISVRLSDSQSRFCAILRYFFRANIPLQSTLHTYE